MICASPPMLRDPADTKRQSPPPVVIFTNAWMMGGMEQQIMDLGRSLARRGRRVAVICYDSPAIEPFRAALRADGIDVHEYRGGAGMLGRVERLRNLVKILRHYPGCILHLIEGWPAGDGLVILAARLSGARAAIRTEQQPPVTPVARRLRLLTRAKDRFLARIICVSEENRRRNLADLGRDSSRVCVVPNCINIEPYVAPGDTASVRADLGIPGGAPIVGLVARLAEERKGARYFVDMAAQVARQEPQAHFILVGDGPLRPGLQAQAESAGVAQRVIFAGYRRDVPRLLKAMTVFVQPSLEEGASLVLLEAMAAGAPVVVTPSGLVPELIVDGENGLVVPMCDAQALAAAVLCLLRDEGRRERIAGAARSLVFKRYSTETMVDQYLEIYEQVGRDISHPA